MRKSRPSSAGFVLLAVLAMLTVPVYGPAHAQQTSATKSNVGKLPINKVELRCVSSLIPGTPPYSKTGQLLEVTNSQSAPIPAGTAINIDYKVRYDESIGLPPQPQHRIYPLTSSLPPGQTIEVVKSAQGPYVSFVNCIAWFNGGYPDLQPLDAVAVRGQLKLTIRNNSTFVAAGNSVAKVRIMKCSQIELGSVKVTVPSIPGGNTQTVLKRVMLPGGYQYFDAIADADGTVKESNESNNTFTGVGVCIR